MAAPRSLRKFYVGRTKRARFFYPYFSCSARSYPQRCTTFYFPVINTFPLFFHLRYFQRFEDWCCDETLCGRTDKPPVSTISNKHGRNAEQGRKASVGESFKGSRYFQWFEAWYFDETLCRRTDKLPVSTISNKHDRRAGQGRQGKASGSESFKRDETNTLQFLIFPPLTQT